MAIVLVKAVAVAASAGPLEVAILDCVVRLPETILARVASTVISLIGRSDEDTVTNKSFVHLIAVHDSTTRGKR